ncbi:MAG: hypothetical protein ACXIUD_09840 [Mongoliitalea sp.]
MQTKQKKIQNSDSVELEKKEEKAEKVMIAFDPDLVNQIGEYLSKRPWAEVNHLLSELQKGLPVNIS